MHFQKSVYSETFAFYNVYEYIKISQRKKNEQYISGLIYTYYKHSI